MKTVEKRYLNERHLAEYSGLSVKTLQRWRLTGDGPAFCRFGGAVRYDLRRFDEWAEENSVNGLTGHGKQPERSPR